MFEAKGTFDVTLTPAPGDASGEGIDILMLEKTYSGGLQGVARGQMISHRTATEGSAGYVAMERVDAELDGRKGSFVLQHNGTMDRGDSALRITVVPDSGSGDLTALKGELQIVIKQNGEHHYVFNYSLG